VPRSNRPRRRPRDEEESYDISRVVLGGRRTEERRDGSWNVQPVSGGGATKSYTCPGCSLRIAPGTAHTVTWRADGLMGEQDDLAARRHWHTHCWTIRR